MIDATNCSSGSFGDRKKMDKVIAGHESLGQNSDDKPLVVARQRRKPDLFPALN